MVGGSYHSQRMVTPCLLFGTNLLPIPKKPNQSLPEGESEQRALPGAEVDHSPRLGWESPCYPQGPFPSNGRCCQLDAASPRLQEKCHNFLLFSSLFSKLLHMITVYLSLCCIKHSGKTEESPHFSKLGP